MRHLDTVQTIYAAFGRGDVPAILAHLDEQIEWEHDAEGWDSYGVPWLRPGAGTRHVIVSVRSTAPELAAMADPQRLDGGRASGHAHTAPA